MSDSKSSRPETNRINPEQNTPFFERVVEGAKIMALLSLLILMVVKLDWNSNSTRTGIKADQNINVKDAANDQNDKPDAISITRKMVGTGDTLVASDRVIRVTESTNKLLIQKMAKKASITKPSRAVPIEAPVPTIRFPDSIALSRVQRMHQASSFWVSTSRYVRHTQSMTGLKFQEPFDEYPVELMTQIFCYVFSYH